MMRIVVATDREVVTFDGQSGTAVLASGSHGRPTCLTTHQRHHGRLWYGTQRDGVFRSDDAGASWQPVGLTDRVITAVAVSPSADVVWAGTEPSEVWRSANSGESWERTAHLETLPSSSQWSFPPKPETHHVRWIACSPRDPERLWVAIEAGALVSTTDGGRTWNDRVSGGPYDTHELAIHPETPDTLRVAAGDGYFESMDGGMTWGSPDTGLEVRYLRSVAIDPATPDVVIVSGSSGPRSAYVAGRADGRLYRRAGQQPWERVRSGWPETPATIAPLLCAGTRAGELWAADERGVHRSDDGGISWHRVAGYARAPQHLRGLVVVA